jgi:hypothetical protein
MTSPVSRIVFCLMSFLARSLHSHWTYSERLLSLMSQGFMRAFLNAIFEWIFGCHHRQLSRVFTIDRKTYQVCFACGRKLHYSWRAMSLIKTSETPQTLASFATAFTQAINNLRGQSRET